MLPFGVLFFLILFGSIVANPIIGYAQDDSEFDDENEGADEDDTSFPPEEEEDEDDTDVVIEEEDEDDTDVVIEEEDEMMIQMEMEYQMITTTVLTHLILINQM